MKTLVTDFNFANLARDAGFSTPTELYKALRAHGIKVSYQAVAKWFGRNKTTLDRVLEIMVIARLNGVQLDLWDYLKARRITDEETSDAGNDSKKRAAA